LKLSADTMTTYQDKHFDTRVVLQGSAATELRCGRRF